MRQFTKYFFLRLVYFMCFSLYGTPTKEPLSVGIIGLTHTHVHWIFGSESKGDIKIVGIVEPNRKLAQQYADQYHFPMQKVYNSMEEMFEEIEPEAVTAFGSIYEHLEVVEKAAPKGIHVMVEKPLAVNMDHASQIKRLARKYNIHVLTNYETSWYPTTKKAYDLIHQGNTIGNIRKIIVNDGHKGPKNIGVNPEFFDWLTDPKMNGGGARIDFGCYGANLITWLVGGKRPKSVTAIEQQLQAENNPLVNDESIILLQYEDFVAIIQGSWNWPIGRKDMEIYGLKGVIYADNKYDLRIRISEGYDGFEEQQLKLKDRPKPNDDPFSYLAALIKNKVPMEAYALSSLENNLIVVEILDAARKSTEEGRTIFLE